MGFAYSPDALVYDSGSNSWSLRPDYDFREHRVEIQINDDDAYLDGDRGADEVGVDSTQQGVVRDLDGNLIASGRIYDDYYYQLTGPSGEVIYIERIEIAGQHVGWIVTDPLQPGVTYTQTDTGDVYYQPGDDDDPGTDTTLRYSEIQSVPCFTAATEIATAEGPVPAGWLRAGDMVVTRDHGLQPVLWVGEYKLTREQLCANPALWPITIDPSATGQAASAKPLTISPWHRVLLRGPHLALCFGMDEAFVAAKHLIGWPGVESKMPTEPVVYHHVLFAHHEIILADGHWTESLFLGDAVTGMPGHEKACSLQAEARRAGGHETLARPELKSWEAALLQPAPCPEDRLEQAIA